jgi:Ni2+-binding GTPase involved in maturation of urease and hydrogenase
MKTVQLIFVGGFLGAGKTTLLWRAAELLMRRDRRVGLITNDQAPDLVDTKWLAEKGLNVREVAGSCFCCNFAGLIYAAEKLLASGTDVLIGEPVGSCTDLSATILQPLKDRFKGQFVLSPLSVLADPSRLADVLGGEGDSLHPDAAYIFRKQLEEADLLVVNKTDLLSPEQGRRLEGLVAAQLPNARPCFLSARTGEGVEPWLDEVLSTREAGTHIIDVDYDVYAAGEAVLGWLNADVHLSMILPPADWSSFCCDLLSRLQTQFRDRRARIGHVKLLLTAASGHCIGNFTDDKSAPLLQGRIDGSPAEANLTLNARVEMPPQELEQIVRDTLTKAAAQRIRIKINDLQCLRPGRPKPTHRYNTIVD